MKFGIFMGSTTGNTETAAEAMKAEIEKKVPNSVTIHNVRTADLNAMRDYDVVVIGCPTWNVGELQEDWIEQLPGFKNIDLSGKKVAMYGVGDAKGYAKNFQDSLGILGEVVLDKGGDVHGFWPVDDYNFEMSEGVVDQHFLGLALDDDNESHKTRDRINAWIQQLLVEVGA